MELVGAAGLNSIEDLRAKHINRRVQGTDVRTYAQLYPTLEHNCLLNDMSIPETWRDDWLAADSQRWGN